MSSASSRSSSSVSSSTSSSSSSSSSSSGGRRRSKHKHKHKKKGGSKKSKQSKDRHKSSFRKDDKDDKKGKRGKARRKPDCSRSPERLFYERDKHLQPIAAATRLQRVIRGHIVRRWSNQTLRRIRVQRKALTLELSEMLIREVLEGEVIPDLLIDIITNGHDSAALAPHPPWLQQQLQLAEMILGEV